MAIDVAYEVLMDPDFLIDIRIRRALSSGQYVNGHFEGGQTQEFLLRASVQPATSEDFQNKEEGERVGGEQVVYSRVQLRGAEKVTSPDLVINYQGKNWKVIESHLWGHHGFFKSIIAKIDDEI